MKKSLLVISGLLMSVCLFACDRDEVMNTPGVEDSIPVIELDVNETLDTPEEDKTVVQDNKEADTEDKENNSEEKPISDDMAKAAVMNYCFDTNAGLQDMVNSGDYTIYWEVEHSDEEQIVVLYRSYTAAEVRFYIDRVSGETYITEFVQGITEEEQKTGETLNIKGYIFENQD